MDIFCIKGMKGLAPASSNDEELLRSIPLGKPVKVKVTQVRNYEFHKKYFALLNLAFDYWEPPECTDWKLFSAMDITPERNFERFRKDVIILAGYYEATYRVNGDIRLEAQSISFGKMSEDEFAELYKKTIDVIIKHVLRQYDGDMLRSIIEQVEDFE